MGANFTEQRYEQRLSPGRRAVLSHLTNGPLHPLLEKTMHKNVDKMFSTFMSAMPVEDIREIYAHWIFDEKTRSQASIPEGSTGMLGNIEVPFAVVQNLGYLNLHQFGAYDLFENAGTPADKRWLILGPPMYDLPVYAWQGEALAFFDHVLRGVENGYTEQPHVRYWTDGADQFSAADTFPPTDGEVKRLYLGSAGADSATHHLTAEPTAPASNRWAAVPFGVPVLPGLEKLGNQILTFDLPVIEDLKLAGPVTARLTFSCNEIDSYVIARLSRMDADGDAHELSLGVIRPIERNEDTDRSTSIEIAIDSERREPLVPGEPVVLRFSLTPGPVLLHAGETLRLDIGSRTDLLRKDPSEGYAEFDLPVPPYLSRNTLHFGGESWIEVTSCRPTVN